MITNLTSLVYPMKEINADGKRIDNAIIFTKHDFAILDEDELADIETADCSGQIKIGVDGSLLRRAAVRLSDTVIISGNGAKDLIHLKSPNIDASVNICPVTLPKACEENDSEK